MAEVRALPLAAMHKERFFRLFRSLSSQDIYIAGAKMKAAERLVDAARMLRQRTPVPAVRDRLMAAHGISRSAAYRLIERARQVEHG